MTTLHDRALTCVVKGRELNEYLSYCLNASHCMPNLVSQAGRDLNALFKALPYKRGVRMNKTHEVDSIAKQWRRVLTDLRTELGPLLDEYNRLYHRRITADYQHSDATS